MKNFMKKHYEHYYIQELGGQVVETTRTDCYSQAESESTENPYKQRWLYDIEAGYIVRLARSKQGEQLYRTIASAIKNDERHYARKYACINKRICGNDGACGNCLKNRTSRTVDLDKPIYADGEGDANNRKYEVLAVDTFAEIEEAASQHKEKENLYMAMRQLNKTHQQIIVLYYFKKKTHAEIAKILGKERSSVTRQLQTALKNLKKFWGQTAQIGN